MGTKTDEIKTYLRQGNLKSALRIAKTFRVGFSVSEMRSIQIASETLSGSTFYSQLGIDIKVEINRAEWVLRCKYNIFT